MMSNLFSCTLSPFKNIEPWESFSGEPSPSSWDCIYRDFIKRKFMKYNFFLKKESDYNQNFFSAPNSWLEVIYFKSSPWFSYADKELCKWDFVYPFHYNFTVYAEPWWEEHYMRHHYELLLTGRRTARISDKKRMRKGSGGDRMWWYRCYLSMRKETCYARGGNTWSASILAGPPFPLSSLLTLVLSPEGIGTIFTTWRDQK